MLGSGYIHKVVMNEAARSNNKIIYIFNEPDLVTVMYSLISDIMRV